eukprot:126117-Rhodomonas_salina.1
MRSAKGQMLRQDRAQLRVVHIERLDLHRIMRALVAKTSTSEQGNSSTRRPTDSLPGRCKQPQPPASQAGCRSIAAF